MIVLEDDIKDKSLKIETLQLQWDKMPSDIIQLVIKKEYLTSEYAELSFKKLIKF